MLEINLSARCFPTEDRQAIAGAITNLFPDAVIRGDEIIEAVSASLETFAEQLKKQRIRDAARAVMRRGLRGGSTSFKLNKQVATVGKISFSEESHPLEDIEVTISSDDIESLISSIAPDTRGGVKR